MIHIDPTICVDSYIYGRTSMNRRINPRSTGCRLLNYCSTLRAATTVWSMDPWIHGSLDLSCYCFIYWYVDWIMDMCVEPSQFIHRSMNLSLTCTHQVRCRPSCCHLSPRVTARSIDPSDPLIHWSMFCCVLFCGPVDWLLFVHYHHVPPLPPWFIIRPVDWSQRFLYPLSKSLADQEIKARQPFFTSVCVLQR